MAFYLAVSVLLFVSAEAQASNKMGNLIGLMETLKKEMVDDAKGSATTYSKVATHCKIENARLAKSIGGETREIDQESAAIGTEDSDKIEKEDSKEKRQANQQGMAKDLAAVVTDCSKKQSVYEADAADSKKAVASLTKAIGQMNARKKAAGGASLLQEEAAANSLIQYTLIVADAMGLIQEPKGSAALLKKRGGAQERPTGIAAVASDPAYKYHSSEITRIMSDLLTEFSGNSKARDTAWGKTESACNAEKKALSGKMKQNMVGMTNDGKAVQGFKADIARDTGDLIREQTAETSDQKDLRLLTKSCQDEAVEWDRKTNLQNTTITALGEVINFLSNKKSTDAGVTQYVTEAKAERKYVTELVSISSHAKAKLNSQVKSLSFLQESKPVKAVTNFLAKGTSSSAAERAKMQKVVSYFRDESGKLSSPVLSMLAMRVAGGHFKEVETMINNLINRLLEESNSEIAKNGFCTTELAKAHKDRDLASAKADLMQADLKTMEAKKEELEEMNQVTLTGEIKQLNSDLSTAVSDRAAGKKANTGTIKTVTEGIEQLSEAQKFYAKAAGARAKMEVETTPQALTDEESIGKGSKAIVALMATIMNDFQTMIKETEAAEKGAQRDFVEYSQQVQSDIASKTMKLKLNRQELATVNNKIKATLEDLDGQTGLVTNAIAMVAGLKPVCLDAGGMNFKDRKVKRDEEVAALKTALQVLRH